jgi:uncharacterized protein YdiU (UPF0061 family)
MPLKTLEQLTFDNSYACLSNDFHAAINPTPLDKPYLIHFNTDAAALLELEHGEALRPEFVGYLTGLDTLQGMQPVAMRYAGHQFGHYVPQLGDGRAILLGEVKTSTGNFWDLHLKGGGQTAYSRAGDGRAVLRSSIREYLCSEAMFHLGVPTTRALCLMGSDEEVYRESIETGAMLLRLAPSHVRFGSFELFYYQQEYAQLETLADYVIARHFPEIKDLPNTEKYPAFLQKIIESTAILIAKWQLVGFSHGVMNTDNMSVLGLTLDYGPYGFLDAYDPKFICNHSDHSGRYAFNKQPQIGLFNLSCLAQALLPLFAGDDTEVIGQQVMAQVYGYETHFKQAYHAGLRAKLGFTSSQTGDMPLIWDLLDQMAASQTDYTIFFRQLCDFNSLDLQQNHVLRNMFVDREKFDQWEKSYQQRLQAEQSQDVERAMRMKQHNPKYILRNYMLQNAIQQAENKDYSELERLFKLLQNPYTDQPEMDTFSYADLPPDWSKSLSVSCSS